jgi:hypothetical protein
MILPLGTKSGVARVLLCWFQAWRYFAANQVYECSRANDKCKRKAVLTTCGERQYTIVSYYQAYKREAAVPLS